MASNSNETMTKSSSLRWSFKYIMDPYGSFEIIVRWTTKAPVAVHTGPNVDLVIRVHLCTPVKRIQSNQDDERVAMHHHSARSRPFLFHNAEHADDPRLCKTIQYELSQQLSIKYILLFIFCSAFLLWIVLVWCLQPVVCPVFNLPLQVFFFFDVH